jgi:hypothetical protein
MRSVLLFSAAMLIAACPQTKPQPKKDPKPTAVVSNPTTAPTSVVTSAPASTPTSAAANIAPASTPASAAAADWMGLPIPALEMGMMDHANVFGWSKDSSEFMFCAPYGGADGDYCKFVTVADNKTEKFSTMDEKTGEEDPKQAKALAARKTKMGYATSKMTAPDLEPIWKAIPGNADDERPVGKFEAGARSLDKTKTATPIMMEFPNNVEVHPDTIEISPDGKYLAVVAHGFFGEYSDHIEVKVVPLDSLRALLK